MTTPDPGLSERLREFADELRKWWSFNDHQRHTHSWHEREDFIEKKLPELLSRLTAAQGVPPKGWKLVPVEPTPEMCDAVFKADNIDAECPLGLAYKSGEDVAVAVLYRAMLAAAPSPPAEGEGG